MNACVFLVMNGVSVAGLNNYSVMFPTSCFCTAVPVGVFNSGDDAARHATAGDRSMKDTT